MDKNMETTSLGFWASGFGLKAWGLGGNLGVRVWILGFEFIGSALAFFELQKDPTVSGFRVQVGGLGFRVGGTEAHLQPV